MIKNRYRIINEIGKGGMGVVYLVQDTFKDNLYFALKTIKQKFLEKHGISCINTFKNEYEIMTRLKHPNLTQVYEFGTYESNYYIVLEYLKGMLLSRTSLKDCEIIDIIVQILRVLEYIHSRNLVYRDLKPGNIMLIDKNIKLMDFGLCSQIKEKDENIRGSLMYMPPESFDSVLTFSWDIFSLGMCFYELITGNGFYKANGSVHNIILLLRNSDDFNDFQAKRLESIKDSAIRHIIYKMTSWNIENRYKSCSEVIADINEKLKIACSYETKETSQSYVLGNEFANRTDEFNKLKANIFNKDRDKFLIYSGSSGIGKSRLFNEFKKYCILNDIMYLEARCNESEIKNYYSIIEILFQLISLSPDNLILRYGKFLKLVIENNIRLKDFEPPLILDDPKLLQEIIVQNITDYILDFSKYYKRPVILFIDDLQWIDHGSYLIVKNLIYRLNCKTSSINNISLYAAIDENKILPGNNIISIFSENGVKKYDLPSFDIHGVREYIHNVFGSECIHPRIEEAISSIREMVGGNPLLLQELIKSLLEKEVIQKDKIFWKIQKPLEMNEIPQNIMDIIKNRMEVLFTDDNKRRILEILSLLRIDININLIKDIIGRISSDIDAAKVLLELEYLEILRFVKINNITYYSFANSLVKHHIRDGINNKIELNLFLAQTLEDLSLSAKMDMIEEIAFLYHEGKNTIKAAYYYEKCGDIAKKVFFNDKAVRHYETALDSYKILLLDAEKQKAENIETRLIEIMEKKASVLIITGKWNDAVKLLEDGIKIAQELLEKDIQNNLPVRSLLGKQKCSLGWILMNKRDYLKAEALFREAKTISDELGDKTEYSRALGNMGILYWYKCDFDKAAEYYNEQKNLCKELGEKTQYARALGNLGNLYIDKSQYDIAMEYYDEWKRICMELKDKRGYSYAIGNIGIAYEHNGEYDKALDYFLEAKRICEELGNKRGYALVIGNIGIVYSKIGNHDKSLKYYRESEKLWLELGDRWGYAYTMGNIGVFHWRTGDASTALKFYKKQKRICEDLGDKKGLSTVLGNIGDVFLKRGDYGKAIRYYNKKLQLCEELGYRRGIAIVSFDLGMLYRDMGNYTKAMDYCIRSESIYREISNKKGMALNKMYMAVIYQDMGDLDQAIHFYEQAENDIVNYIKAEIPFMLLNKAKLFFKLNYIEKAIILCNEAIKTASNMEKKDILFQSRVMLYKIKKETDILKEMLNEKNLDDEQTAIINYELWKLTDDIKYRKEAGEIYHKLLSATPRYEYRKRAEELKL